jgi:phi LC3 family holin
MKINWKARFKNKTFVITFFALIIAFIYQILGLFGIVPSISEDTIMNIFTLIVNALGTLGVLVDPTTDGVSDSSRALTYYTENDERMVE